MLKSQTQLSTMLKQTYDTKNYYNEFEEICDYVKTHVHRDGTTHYTFLLPRKKNRCKLHGLC
jgi:hypothetical protein